MASDSLRKRSSQLIPEPHPNLGAGSAGVAEEPHPAGEVKHGSLAQLLRMLLFASWFDCVCIAIGFTQYFGSPLYFINKDYYYAFMAMTKQSFGICVTTITQWFSPTLVRISWDASLQGQLRKTSDGRLETTFPERMILMANHQIYTDWLYLWWIAYTSRMHGHIFIILKESLKYIPIMGTGMMFFGFIFMSRSWANDKPRLQHRLEKLKSRHSGPMAGRSEDLDPMWLMIYPEGTNLSANTRRKNRAYADKQGIEDVKHQLLPRSTGLFFCLQQLRGTVEYVYDCTMAYEGTPKDGYAQDFFTLRSTYFQGRPPASVNMYWRRFPVSDIPLDDVKAFEVWLMERWREKDLLLEYFYETGVFPAAPGPDGMEKVKGRDSHDGYIETSVRLANWYEVLQIFAPLAALAMVANVFAKLWYMFR